MINQDRVREMNKMAILESGAGEKELKISTYRRADLCHFTAGKRICSRYGLFCCDRDALAVFQMG